MDAAIQLVPFNYMAEEAGFSNLGDVDEFVPDFLFCAVCTRLSWANAHAKQLTGLLRALRRGTEALYDDPDGAAATISSETQGNPEHARRACRDLVAKKAIGRHLPGDQHAMKREALRVDFEGNSAQRPAIPSSLTGRHYLKEDGTPRYRE